MARRESEFTDPYGAPEYWIDCVHREMASPTVVRMIFGTHERGECIMRVKLLVSLDVLDHERSITNAFIAARRGAGVPN